MGRRHHACTSSARRRGLSARLRRRARMPRRVHQPGGMGRLEKSSSSAPCRSCMATWSSALARHDGSRGSGGVAVGWMPGEGLHRAEIESDVSVGLGVLSYFGLTRATMTDWVGRYIFRSPR